MKVPEYIKELLFLHDCVIIPGFGGFVANYRNAGYDETQNLFIPPGKDISFNASLKHNDGLLISYISSEASISYEQARKKTEDFVSEVNQTLQTREYTFKEIGKFRLENDTTVRFFPDQGANFLAESYGLPYFHFKPLSSQKVEEKIQKTLTNREAIHTVVKRKRYKRILIAAPFVIALSLLPLKMGEYFNEPGKGSLVEVRFSPDTPAVSETTPEIYTTQVEEVPSDLVSPVHENTQEILEEPEKNISHSFFLIAGSFSNYSNAETCRRNLKSEGYNTEILSVKNTLYRVSMAAFTTKDAALQELTQIKKQKGRESVWLYSHN